jgi:chemotaxis regulatin CheY-phosphate phosphatase CheZ
MASAESIDKNIESLVEITDSILKGEFNEWKTVIDAEGMLSILAQKINTLVVNMKNVESPLTSAGEQAPTAVSSAKNVIELMAQATGQVLDSADQLEERADALEAILKLTQEQNAENAIPAQKELTAIKSHLLDIIGSQSYQDVARQKMESLISDLNQIRDWLIEVLLIFNIRKDNSPENVQKKTEILKEVSEASTPDGMKQDLVDDLLAEFGY